MAGKVYFETKSTEGDGKKRVVRLEVDLIEGVIHVSKHPVNHEEDFELTDADAMLMATGTPMVLAQGYYSRDETKEGYHRTFVKRAGEEGDYGDATCGLPIRHLAYEER